MKNISVKLSILSFAFLSNISIAEPIYSIGSPYTFQQVLAWQKSLGKWPWTFPPNQAISLKKGAKQQLLAIDGGARSGKYILFNKNANNWIPISDEIEQSHLSIRVLDNQVNGWHDFQTFFPLWSSNGEKVAAYTYRWNRLNPGKYILIKEQYGKFSDFPHLKVK